MITKTTVAIDDALRKRIKKIAAWLDITQGEVINNAIEAYEKIIFQNNPDERKEDDRSSIETTVRKILTQATQHVWETDPEARELQQRLMSRPENIDDFIIKKWRTGLFE